MSNSVHNLITGGPSDTLTNGPGNPDAARMLSMEMGQLKPRSRRVPCWSRTRRRPW